MKTECEDLGCWGAFILINKSGSKSEHRYWTSDLLHNILVVSFLGFDVLPKAPSRCSQQRLAVVFSDIDF